MSNRAIGPECLLPRPGMLPVRARQYVDERLAAGDRPETILLVVERMLGTTALPAARALLERRLGWAPVEEQ